MQKDSLRLWIAASRPKTLTAGASPVIVASAIALRDDVFNLFIALNCLLVAILFQITSNFINEYIDFKKGADTAERIGPQRAVSQGLISPKQMAIASWITVTIACVIGLYLAFSINLWLIVVGLLIAIFAYAYTGGPYPMAYNGLGDVCVIVFYGLIPVIFTYYVQSETIATDVILSGLGVGIATTNILVANNYRDYEEDKKHHKRTSIVIFGKRFGRAFYLSNGLLATGLFFYLLFSQNTLVAILPLAFIPLHISNFIRLKRAFSPDEKIAILGKTSIGVFLLSILFSIGILI